jgi:integral membrane protein (TIGR01906 family)
MNNFIKIIISLFSFFIIILIPIFLIIWQYNLFIPKIDNFEIASYQEELMGYLINKKELPQTMTELEASHMKDVKDLVTFAYLLLLFSIFISLLFYFILKRKNKLYLFYQSLHFSAIIILILIVIFIILSIFNFDYIFILFHEVFFPQGNWLFPANSKLVQAFPEILFKKLFLYSFIISGLIALIIFLLNFKIIKTKE